MPASRCCSGDKAVVEEGSGEGLGFEGSGLAGSGSEEFAGSEVAVGLGGVLSDEVGGEDERLEGCGAAIVGEAEPAGGAAVGSRVGPQLAASKKKTTSKVAAALRMFQTRPQHRLSRPSGRAAERTGESLRVSFLVKAAISPLSPSIQTNLGRSCGDGGSRLPTSWG